MTEVNQKISIALLSEMSKKMFGGLVKAVVDIKQEKMIVDASMHADEEKLLLENGSEQGNLWGINLYPEMYGDEDFIEFDSMINLRPNEGNTSRSVESPEIRKQIISIVNKLVEE